jgi:hypothetical protein
MKTKPTKIDRSGAKWLPGAMALAATAASSQAATVQITLSGNKISTTGANQLNADLTGDLVADVTFETVVLAGTGGEFRASVRADGLGTGNWVGAGGVGGFYNAQADAGGDGVGDLGGSFMNGEALNRVKLNTVVFSDDRINGGDPTEAWLEVNAFNSSSSSHTVQLTRLIFDDASTTRPAFTSIPGVQTQWVAAVPEPSGFLATSLLLGAAGLIRRRQAKAA